MLCRYMAADISIEINPFAMDAQNASHFPPSLTMSMTPQKIQSAPARKWASGDNRRIAGTRSIIEIQTAQHAAPISGPTVS